MYTVYSIPLIKNPRRSLHELRERYATVIKMNTYLRIIFEL